MHTCQKMCLHLEKIRKTVISFLFLFNFNNIKYVIIVIHITIVEKHAKGLMLTSLFYFLSFLLSQHTYMYIHDISNKLVYTMVFLTVWVSIWSVKVYNVYTLLLPLDYLWFLRCTKRQNLNRRHKIKVFWISGYGFQMDSSEF